MTDKIEAMTGERGSKYGPFDHHANITQDLKRAIRERLEANLRARGDLHTRQKDAIREGLEMIFHKIGRIVNGDVAYQDSWDDIAGYANITSKAVGPDWLDVTK